MIKTMVFGTLSSLIFSGGCLLFGKCFFQKSIVVDKKSVVILFLASILDGITEVWTSSWNILTSVSSLFLLVFCFGRGGVGKIRRLLSALEVCAFFYLSIMFYVIDMYSMYYWNDVELTFLDRTERWFYLGAFLIFLLLCYVYVTLYRKKIVLELQIRDKLLLSWYCLFLIGFSGLWLILAEESKITLPKSFSNLCMLMLTLLVFQGFFGLIKKKLTDYYKKGQEYQQEYMEMELAHFREYKQAQDETRRVRHDMKNNLTCISMLLEEGKNQEAKDYVEQLLGEVKAFSPKVVTGDEMLDAIVASKWSKMEERHISFQLDGVLDQGLNWKPIDVCTVFSNGLDNAIEACEKVEKERSISLSLKYTRNFYYIILSNTVKGNVSILEHEIGKWDKKSRISQEDKSSTINEGELVIGSRYTTKKNKELHGYGLENMNRTIEKYDGNMSIQQEGNRFILKIMVPCTE